MVRQYMVTFMRKIAFIFIVTAMALNLCSSKFIMEETFGALEMSDIDNAENSGSESVISDTPEITPENANQCVSFAVDNGKIYFPIKYDNVTLYRMNTDGSDRRALSDDRAESFSVWDERIYFTITGANIYSIDTDGSSRQMQSDLSTNAYTDVTYEVKGRLHKDIPEYRYIASGMKHGSEDYEIGYVMGLKVYDDKGEIILSADFSETNGDETTGYPVFNEMMDTMGLHIVDVNFDGYKDVIILNTFCGAHANTWYDCWLWDPDTSSFEACKSFSQICNPSLDPDNKCIYSTGGSGASFWGGSIYKFLNGEFVMANDLYTDWTGVKETALIDGKTTVVREVIYPADDPEKAAEMEDAEMKYYQDSDLWQLNNPRWYWHGGHHADKWLER